MRSRIVAALSLVALLAMPAAAAAKHARKEPPSVGLYSPNGYIEPGSAMYDYAEVRLAQPGLTGGFAACEQYMTGRVVTNGEPVDIVAFTESFSDEYCEGQMRLARLPRIEYSGSGSARLSGSFVVELTFIGCVYELEHLSADSYGRHLEVSMSKGRGRLLRREPVHGSCPRRVGASFSIYGAYDSPSMYPWQMDSRTQLQAASSPRRRDR